MPRTREQHLARLLQADTGAPYVMCLRLVREAKKKGIVSSIATPMKQRRALARIKARFKFRAG